MKSINMEGGFSFCGGWNFSKSVSVDSTFIREMRVPHFKGLGTRNFCPNNEHTSESALYLYTLTKWPSLFNQNVF